MNISDKQFEELMDDAIARTPTAYKKRLQNVAFLVDDDPTAEQRQRLKLRDNQTLLGLYEGVPLPARNGATKILPDKITIFKKPLLAASHDMAELRENIRHTVWHEIAHYFGLDHQRIYELDGHDSSGR